MAAKVTAVRSVEFGVADVDQSVKFYEDAWGLSVVKRNGSAYLRATGPEHHVVVLHKTDQPGLVRANLAAERGSVDELYESVQRAGARPLGKPGPLDEPGGGYGFTFIDPEGRELRIVADVAQHRESSVAEDRPLKVSHVVLNAGQIDSSIGFFREALGFRLRDETARMSFLGCNADHHSIALTRIGNVSLNHVAFEVPSWDALMRGLGRLKRKGVPVEWGVGRHGPGNNIFAYFLDPNELAVEYTADIEQVDDATYKPRGPKEWKPPIEGNPDYLGAAELPSKRFEQATSGRVPAAAHH